MRIRRIEVIEIRLPTRRDARWRALETRLGNYALVKLETTDGLVGVGEATVLPDWGGDYSRRYGEDPAIVAHVIERYLAPALEAMDPFDICSIHEAMNRRVRGYPYTKAAVDMALLLAGSQPAIRLPCVICASAPRETAAPRVACRYYLDDVIAAPLPYHDGRLRVPESPGLGIALDEDKIAAYTVRVR